MQNYHQYHTEALRILSDTEYYCKVKSNPFTKVQSSLNELIQDAREKRILTKKEVGFLIIPEPNTPFFYHLPKVHKDLKDPPGRPIISGINSSTCNLSHFIDVHLQDYVKNLDSFLKDSDSLIKILKTLQWEENYSFLTLDVTSLYSNIDHKKGMECTEHFLKGDLEIPPLQRTFLMDCLEFILYNNFFTYDGDIYHQAKGTAMGTRMAPSYANLFMGVFEELFLMADHPFRKNIMVYRRYIDDLFFLWKGNQKDAADFVESLNTNSWGIKFTLNFSEREIEFLDLLITHDNHTFITSTFFKKVDANSYLDFNSGHFHKWKQNVPFGQFRRVRKNCTSDTTFKEQAEVISKRFLDKGYPKGLINNARKKAEVLSQEQCLTTKQRDTGLNYERVNFITTFNRSHAKIQQVFSKHWHILKKDPYLRDILPANPQITYKRPPTLKTILAPSKLRRHRMSANKDKTKGVFRCKHKKCLCCSEINDKAKTFSSTQTEEIFQINHNFTCQSSYVIYLLQCICKRQYVGRTIQNLHKRMNKHRANIKKGFLLHGVSRHCSTEHPAVPHPITVTPIDFIDPTVQNRFETLKKREMFWIYRLKTLQPSGLNEITEMVES